MKKLLLILLCLPMIGFGQGSIISLTVFPTYPTETDTVYIYASLSFASSSCPLDVKSHSILGNNIVASTQHCLGMLTAICYNTDTFKINPLSTGTYTFDLTLSSGFGGPPCTPGIVPNDYDTITFYVSSLTFALKTYVPDDNFETYLENNGMGDGIALNDSVFTSAIDTVGYLYVTNMNISDLTGIEDFTALDTLICNDNQLDSLEVSMNTALTYLQCWGNNLFYLNISQNSLLRSLYCEDNQLATLDLSGAVSLKYFYCDNNQLTSLDVSNNILLRWLQPQSNQLVSLDISNLTVLRDLDCAYNNITSLDISSNTQLISLDSHDNYLIFLDMRNGNNQSMDLNTSNNPFLTCINVDDVAWSTANWTVANGNIDSQNYFSADCSLVPLSWNCINNACVNPGDGSGTFTDSLVCVSTCIQTVIFDQINNPKAGLTRIIDVLGREKKGTRGEPLFYIYDDGTVEQRIVIE